VRGETMSIERITATKPNNLLNAYQNGRLSETINGLVPVATVIKERQQIKNDINNNINNWLNSIYGYARFIAAKTTDERTKNNAKKIMSICSDFQAFNQAIGVGV